MTTNTATRAVTARRTIACPRDAVFRAWTDPEELIGWWGGEHVVLLSATVDLRVEGSYRLTVQSGDRVGTVHGVYREVEAPDRLVYTWRWDAEGSEESLVTVEFRDLGGTTEVVVTHEALESMASLVFHQGGWAASLEALTHRLEKG